MILLQYFTPIVARRHLCTSTSTFHTYFSDDDDDDNAGDDTGDGASAGADANVNVEDGAYTGDIVDPDIVPMVDDDTGDGTNGYE